MSQPEPNNDDDMENEQVRRFAVGAGYANLDDLMLASFKRALNHARSLSARLPRDLQWCDEPGWKPACRAESKLGD